MKRNIGALAVTTLWVNASEFFRNQVLFPDLWVAHYQQLGLVFPSAPVNGAVWGLWGLSFASVLFVLNRFLTWPKAALLGWFVGFAMMWQVLWNLSVLPVRLLPFAAPLSALEALVGSFLVSKLSASARRD